MCGRYDLTRTLPLKPVMTLEGGTNLWHISIKNSLEVEANGSYHLDLGASLKLLPLKSTCDYDPVNPVPTIVGARSIVLRHSCVLMCHTPVSWCRIELEIGMSEQ